MVLRRPRVHGAIEVKTPGLSQVSTGPDAKLGFREEGEVGEEAGVGRAEVSALLPDRHTRSRGHGCQAVSPRERLL